MSLRILNRSEFSGQSKIAFRFGAFPLYVDIVAVREPPMSRADAITQAPTRPLQRLRESEKCMQDYPTTPQPQPSQPGQADAPAPQPIANTPPAPAPHPDQATFAPPAPQYSAPTPMPDAPPPYTPAPASAPAYNPTYAPPYPVPSAANLQDPPRSNRTKWLIGGGIGCGALLVMCMCVGLLTAILAQGGSSTASGDPTATTQQGQAQKFAPTATTAPQPTATTNPNAGAGAYATLVQQDSTTLGNDLSSVSDACSSTQDLSTCRAAWVTIRDDSASFLDDLDTHPAPPCMKTADKSLRAGLNDVHAASLEVIDGIDQYDPAKINNGATILTKANGEVNDATSALKNANCS